MPAELAGLQRRSLPSSIEDRIAGLGGSISGYRGPDGLSVLVALLGDGRQPIPDGDRAPLVAQASRLARDAASRDAARVVLGTFTARAGGLELQCHDALNGSAADSAGRPELYRMTCLTALGNRLVQLDLAVPATAAIDGGVLRAPLSRQAGLIVVALRDWMGVGGMPAPEAGASPAPRVPNRPAPRAPRAPIWRT